ncbi:Hypothetical protein CINCED_3A001205 [Cinara cedri]|uniref:Uncharacterized protein n=1 Tax=Cinara cedri TaxID=506608 RepID=A0A5E4MS43_9HEMI|nr:Hypothetical protein CINCED_3A001205 [Cinara cedri]
MEDCLIGSQQEDDDKMFSSQYSIQREISEISLIPTSNQNIESCDHANSYFSNESLITESTGSEFNLNETVNKGEVTGCQQKYYDLKNGRNEIKSDIIDTQSLCDSYISDEKCKLNSCVSDQSYVCDCHMYEYGSSLTKLKCIYCHETEEEYDMGECGEYDTEEGGEYYIVENEENCIEEEGYFMEKFNERMDNTEHEYVKRYKNDQNVQKQEEEEEYDMEEGGEYYIVENEENCIEEEGYFMEEFNERMDNTEHKYVKKYKNDEHVQKQEVSFKENSQIDVIFTDSKKAFNRVDHELFLIALKRVGFEYQQKHEDLIKGRNDKKFEIFKTRYPMTDNKKIKLCDSCASAEPCKSMTFVSAESSWESINTLQCNMKAHVCCFYKNHGHYEHECTAFSTINGSSHDSPKNDIRSEVIESRLVMTDNKTIKSCDSCVPNKTCKFNSCVSAESCESNSCVPAKSCKSKTPRSIGSSKPPQRYSRSDYDYFFIIQI